MCTSSNAIDAPSGRLLDERRADRLAARVVPAVGPIATEVEHAVVGQVGQGAVDGEK
jgi:hypothetical protein